MRITLNLKMQYLYGILHIIHAPQYDFILQKKCEKYWPDELHSTVTKDYFAVTFTSIVPSAEYEIRKLTLSLVRQMKLLC